MVQGIGIAILLKWRNGPGIITLPISATATGVFFAALTFSYHLVSLPGHRHKLFDINSSGILIAFALATVTIIKLRPSVGFMTIELLSNHWTVFRVN